MKICPKCNLQYPDDKKFCKKCGASLLLENPSESKIVELKPSIEVDSTSESLPNPNKNFHNSKNKSRLLLWSLIVSFALILIFILLYIIYYLKQNSAWDKAQHRNTISAYQEYINIYPNGRYIVEAKNKQRAKKDSIIAIQNAIDDSIAAAQKAKEDAIAGISSPTSNIQSTLIIKGSKVNIRSNPSVLGNVFMQLNSGDICEIIEKGNLENVNGISDYWYKIRFNGQIGWVYGNFTNLSTHSTGSIYGNYPMTSLRSLTSSDLTGKSKWELKIMRNEIFARHGYLFKTQDMKSYFESQSWYHGQFTDVSSMLTELEKQNISLIKEYE